MIIDGREIKYMNRFITEEVTQSIGIPYAPVKIKSCFQINKKDDIWGIRKKK